MAATALKPELAPPAEAPVEIEGDAGMMALALEIWHRGSLPAGASEEEDVSAEECALIPH